MTEALNISSVHRWLSSSWRKCLSNLFLNDLWLNVLCLYKDSLCTFYILSFSSCSNNLVDLSRLDKRLRCLNILNSTYGNRSIQSIERHPCKTASLMNPFTWVILLIKLCLCNVFRIYFRPSMIRMHGQHCFCYLHLRLYNLSLRHRSCLGDWRSRGEISLLLHR